MDDGHGDLRFPIASRALCSPNASSVVYIYYLRTKTVDAASPSAGIPRSAGMG